MEDEDDEEVDSEGSGSEDENMSCMYNDYLFNHVLFLTNYR